MDTRHHCLSSKLSQNGYIRKQLILHFIQGILNGLYEKMQVKTVNAFVERLFRALFWYYKTTV